MFEAFFLEKMYVFSFSVYFLQDRMFASLTDIISVTTLLSITPTVRDALLAFKRGDLRGTVLYT